MARCTDVPVNAAPRDAKPPSVSDWFKWLHHDTLAAMHRDLLQNGVFDDSDEGRLTTAVLKTIEREAGVRALKRSAVS